MRTIHKRKEPRALVEARVAGVTFGTLDAATKGALRAQLVEEQGGLCCYCMARIRPETCRIEHYRPQSSFPDEGLAYPNLLAACHGNEGASPTLHHCDVRKGNRTIRFDPRHPSAHADGVRYGANGDIRVPDPAHQDELDHVLGLNLEHLKRNRKAADQAVLTRLKNHDWDLTRVRRFHAKYIDESAGELPPYAGVVAQRLQRYLSRPARGP